MQRKKQPLWFWGVILIILGPAANAFLRMVDPIQPPFTSAERGELVGRGVASLAAIITGIVLIIVDRVRAGRQKDQNTPGDKK